MNEAYLSNYEKDCLTLSIAELVEKYPNVPRAELERNKAELENVCCEVNQKRFLKWLKKNTHLIFRY